MLYVGMVFVTFSLPTLKKKMSIGLINCYKVVKTEM